MQLLGLLTMLLCFPALFFFAVVVVRLFKVKGLLDGLLGAFFPPYTYVWGWLKASEQDLGRTMLLWTGVIVLQVALVVILSLLNK
jgi:hypothetical protein